MKEKPLLKLKNENEAQRVSNLKHTDMAGNSEANSPIGTEPYLLLTWQG